MEMNFKKLCIDVVGPDLANIYEYRQLIGALMFLVNTRSNICFVVNTLSQIHEGAPSFTLGCCKTHSKIFAWDN